MACAAVGCDTRSNPSPCRRTLGSGFSFSVPSSPLWIVSPAPTRDAIEDTIGECMRRGDDHLMGALSCDAEVISDLLKRGARKPQVERPCIALPIAHWNSAQEKAAEVVR